MLKSQDDSDDSFTSINSEIQKTIINGLDRDSVNNAMNAYVR